MLPTKKTPKRHLLSDLSILIYGVPKIGKSTFCAAAENGLFLATEPGLNSLETYQVSIQTWEQMLDICGEIQKGEHDFNVIIIDTVDNAYQLCIDYICTQHKKSHLADFSYGKGWSLANNEFQRVLFKIAHLPYGLFLVSHTREKEIETRTGTYSKIVPTLPDSVRKIVLGLVDIILYCDIDEENNSRIVYTAPSHYYEAGDRTGRLPSVLPLNYNTFIESWNASVSS